MKIVTFTLALLTLIGATAFSQGGKSLTLHVGGQSIVVPADAKSAAESGRTYVVAGKNTPFSGTGASFYGIRPAGKGTTVLSRAFIELRDAAGNRLVRTISAADLFGSGSDGWKQLADEAGNNPEKMTSVYSFVAQGEQFNFYRTLELVRDEHLPGGRGIAEGFAVRSEKNSELTMRISLECDGAFTVDGNSCAIGDSPVDQKCRAQMVLNAGSATITRAGAQKNGEPSRFTIQSGAVTCSAGSRTQLLSLTLAATTVGRPDYARKQARDIMAWFNNRVARPDLAAISEMDRTATNPGDTVTCTIVYHNIGTAPGADIAISNPVPPGTMYVENTAGGKGGAVTLKHSEQNIVTAVEWKFDEPILPGEDRSVQFKVVVQ
jgi:uncharacterized repeat protein (TIGR01451 family)